MKKYKLSQSTVEKLGYYVYLLVDPRNKKVFYVGKGKGNRINQHSLGALVRGIEKTEKNKKIREIRKAGKEVKLIVLRHKVTDEESFKIESSVIDLINYLDSDSLTNLVKGHHSKRGLADLKELKIRYEAEDAKFDEPAILIRINRLYRDDISPKELYEATRKYWRVGPRAKSVRIACAVYAGIVREVYTVKKWSLLSRLINGRKRWAFTGEVAQPKTRNKYIYKSVAHIWKPGSQNPIKYVG